MDNLELSYQGIKTAIKDELNRIAVSFVEIGYRLKQVRDGELYKIDGYENINEFAKAEYSLTQSTTSRFMAINDKYSVDGSSPKLLEQYEGYGYSKLSEMLTLSEDEIKLVTVQTTRAEIREIKEVKKESASEIYAPAHNAESLENTQLQPDFEDTKKFNFPNAEKLIIEFFRDKKRRGILKELAAVLNSNEQITDIIAKAIEIINPSGYEFFRQGLAVISFQEKDIKYSMFKQPTIEFTYNAFIRDILSIFDMSLPDPALAFYGEPEPEPEPPKKEPPKAPEKPKAPDKKETSKPIGNKPSKPAVTQLDQEEVSEEGEEENDESIEEVQEDVIPGQKQIEEYPEFMPDGSSEEEEEYKDTVSEVNETVTEYSETVSDKVEIVEADIVMTDKRKSISVSESSTLDEIITWHPMAAKPESNQYVLIAILHHNIPDVIMGHYHDNKGFTDTVYSGAGCTYQYWAYKPNSPLIS